VSAEAFTHCPNCLAEHRAGFTICTNCGSLLVEGRAPIRDEHEGVSESAPGALAFGVRERDEEERDRFSLEETPVVLTAIVPEDVDAFLAALDEEEIGARAGEATDDGGVEILVHAANVSDAQAVLVEFTGDVTLVDDIGVETDGRDAMAVVATARLGDAGAMAARLRERGLDVRIELPEPAMGQTLDRSASILVAEEELERAREILGIER
jgi:hypothetical protein